MKTQEIYNEILDEKSNYTELNDLQPSIEEENENNLLA